MSVRFWNWIAKRYSKQAIADQEAYEKKLELTQKHFTKESQVLEFGCGTGSTALIHAPFVKHILAIDYSKKMIEIASEKAKSESVTNVEFRISTLEQLGDGASNYDAVLGLNVLHLLANWRDVIRRSCEHLKPGGIFVTSTICMGENPGIWKYFLPVGGALGLIPNVQFIRPHEYEEVIRGVGFEILTHLAPGKDKNGRFVIARKISED